MLYPSTLEERRQWESKHRARMSSQPVKPGEKFAEDGLYRAVRQPGDASYRGLLLKQFRAGAVAPAKAVKMPLESGNGEINGPVQWVWEGEMPQSVRSSPFKYIEGTEHSCAPGEICPRDGRWVFRTDTLQPEYHYDLKRIITLRRGQLLPPNSSNDPFAQ